jgi:photosystem II stability/assembly factor-like uncharacterized protein
MLEPPQSSVTSVDFLEDPARVWSVGTPSGPDGAGVAESLDQGHSWQRTDATARERILSLELADDDTLLAVTAGGLVLRSGDGGESCDGCAEAPGRSSVVAWLAGLVLVVGRRRRSG